MLQDAAVWSVRADVLLLDPLAMYIKTLLRDQTD